MIRVITILLVLVVNFVCHSYCQKFSNELKSKVSKCNLVDFNGLKQGKWIDYTFEFLPACNDTFLIIISEGEYRNNKKIGHWEYKNHTQLYGCNEFTLQGVGWGFFQRKNNIWDEYYYENGDVEVNLQHGYYCINNDSTKFYGYIKNRSFKNDIYIDYEMISTDGIVYAKLYKPNGDLRFIKQYNNLKIVIEEIEMGICNF